MLLTPQPRETAWAPWRRDRDWLIRRDQLAARWLVDRGKTEGSQLVVQGTSHADDYRDGDGAVAHLARAGKVATYRSPVGAGATFVPNADIRLLATGIGTARGHSLVATESPTFPLVGWAMATGAVNLETGERTEDTRTAEQIEMVEAFADQLYNGWSHQQVGRRASAYYLPKLAESGMSYEVFVGSLLAVDPGHLDSNPDIDAMKKALPPAWRQQQEALVMAWRRHV